MGQENVLTLVQIVAMQINMQITLDLFFSINDNSYTEDLWLLNNSKSTFDIAAGNKGHNMEVGSSPAQAPLQLI